MIGTHGTMDFGQTIIKFIVFMLMLPSICFADIECDSCTVDGMIIEGKVIMTGTSPLLNHTTVVVSSAEAIEVDTGTTGASITNTIAYGGTLLLDENVSGSHNAFSVSGKTGTGTESFTNELWSISNPFRSASDFHLHPVNGRFLMEVGTSSSATTDVDGQRRTKGASPDIGADEYWAIISPQLFFKP